MSIDWFTIIAQALNFVILLWLMKRFLYKPILDAIDKREKRIADELANAEQKEKAARKLKEEYDRKNGELKAQSVAFIKKAQDEGNSEKTRLLQEARDEADSLSEKRREELIAEETTLYEAVHRRTVHEALAISRKVLTDLAGTSLDERIVGVFTSRLRDLDTPEKEALISALKKKSADLTVRTALDLSPELQGAVESSIKEVFGTQPKVIFESAPDLISGIELGVDGQKVAWSVADYVSSIEEGFDNLFKVHSR